MNILLLTVPIKHPVHVDAIHNIVYYSCEVCEIKQDLKRFLENIKVS